MTRNAERGTPFSENIWKEIRLFDFSEEKGKERKRKMIVSALF